MSSANITNEKPIAAFVGIDWADQKHDIVLCAATSKAQFDHRSIGSDPDALAGWAMEMQGRFGSQGRILICLEQSRGALIHFLMGYKCFELYPINPKQLSSYRAAFRPSGAKDDPVDGKLLCQLIALHHQSLRPWRPDDEATRKLALLCEKRRKAIDTRTALSNQLKSELKLFFPLALSILDNDLTSALAADFLLAWPNFDSLKKASVNKVRKFFYAHQSRSEPKIQERLKCIEAARPLTRDSAIIETSSIAVRMLAQQLKNLVPFIALYDQLISELFDSHPDSALFNNLPGARKQLAPRLLTAFGSDRERFQCLLEALTFFGLAPVTEQSGKSKWVHFRWACPKFLRQSFHEFAAQSVRSSPWAASFYQQQRARGKGHHAAVRALSYKWTRILYRCWKTRQPYNPELYLTALLQRGSPYASALNNSTQKS